MRPKSGQDVLEYEIRAEQAATIGRLARDLRRTLDALAAYDKRTSRSTAAADPRRVRLVDEAAYALWHFVVQRDCAGMRFTEEFLQDHAVPAEVRARMGAVRPRSPAETA